MTTLIPVMTCRQHWASLPVTIKILSPGHHAPPILDLCSLQLYSRYHETAHAYLRLSNIRVKRLRNNDVPLLIVNKLAGAEHACIWLPEALLVVDGWVD